ncbi:aminotransferase [Planomonospora sp. ID82291]|uniref:aminotransferase n=1 Tax=Planomonospora sp. ID82291 TaxID=2738136 RepID=UPI0018C364D5|nr:aminotransferase [Planomonospora sp. ID82291]MBG0816356.1 aminotransferase [Planomonospora sp. ID82291]
MRLSPRTVHQIDSPFGAARELAARRCGRRELLDLSQAAPRYPAAPAVVEHTASVARDAHGGEYTDIAGLPHLREAFAAELSQSYLGHVREEQVVVTAGCNQAFCLVVSALAEAGDEVVLALPYYPNHDMWLRLNGIRPVYLDPGPDLVPGPEAAEALITPRTRAIVLVTPGNPSGVTAGPDAIERLAEVAGRHGIALILDETYRSFRDTAEPAHRLLSDLRWEQTAVSLHSFSKDYAIPGYRVGAVVASPRLNREVMKLLDCVAICAPRIGQEAAWAGVTRAQEWRAARAYEVREKRRHFAAVMAERPGGFELVSAGGFFAWVRHPFAGRSTEEVVHDLVITYDTLVIPGTAFLPEDDRMFRVSFNNVDRKSFSDFAERLTAAGIPHAAAHLE